MLGRRLVLVSWSIFVLGTVAAPAAGRRPEPSGPRAPAAAEEPAFRLPDAWQGDLDGMAERRLVRVATCFSKTGFFLDGAQQRGLVHDAVVELGKALDAELATPKGLPIRVVFVPVARDALLPAVVEGHADLAIANLTVTPERERLVAFSAPTAVGVKEVLVTGPSAPRLESLDDLAGRELHLRRSSSYWESVEALNARLEARGLRPVSLVAADEALEDEDLLELVSAGVLPWTIADDHLARLWVDVLPRLALREDLAVREGGAIAWAMRRDSPRLKEAVDRFVAKSRKGTLLGNVLLKRYLKDNPWVRNPLATEDYRRFQAAMPLFQEQAARHDFDWMLVAAQAYQESRIDQSLRSKAGAVGVMQVLPSTAADPNVGVADITTMAGNVEAGVKYLRFLRDRYFGDEAIPERDRFLFAMAAYNAGPARIAKVREAAKAMGLDPNRWFYNVEIAAARAIGQETTQYVSNVVKYHYAYRSIAGGLARKDEAARSLGGR